MAQSFSQHRQRTFSSLRIRNYRLYFTGQAISLSGTWLQTISQSWLMLKLTNSGTDVGFLVAAQFLPMLLFGPFGGIIADRFPKRKILYITQSTAMILALILGILVATHTIHVWMLFALAASLGLVNVVDNPTRQTFVMEMVGKEDLTNAVSLNSVEVNLARVIGPAIAGILIATVGIAICFFVNSASYIAVLVYLHRMNGAELHPSNLARRARGQLMEGFRYVKRTPILRNVLLMMALIGTLSYEFQVVLPVFATRSFHGGAGIYALLTAAMGFGSVFGGLYVANQRKNTAKYIVAAAIGFGVSMLLAAGSPDIVLGSIAMILVGFFSISFTARTNSALQLNSAPEMRGRVMSLWTVAFVGSTPIGGPIIGFISEKTNPRWGLVVGGLTAIITGFFGVLAIRNRITQKNNQIVYPEIDEK